MDTIYVLATERAATARALRRAGEMSQAAAAPVVLLVPHVSGFGRSCCAGPSTS